ncbi:DUF4893 domain-containing protein [Sphingomonas naphthae]|uniref:DUF4893 domain-containing protein n=1 Tax=Sphingomonas naphthae TaxID=1813468 RepID=A0ABY7TMS5_9SPHN|nr:DUF4893 domain-containing protein [Sphingomonas naphthae]WCT74318.1 DUF4893 domain-containing protein [Sphingomonas naphthae]
MAIGAALLGGCGGGGGGDRPASAADRAPERNRDEAASASDWRSIASDNDRRRLRNWRQAWEEVLATLGTDPRVAREGALLSPDVAMTGVLPPVGDYRCRVIKLGSQARGGLDYVAYPSFNCRIGRTGGVALSLLKLTGSQRPVGLLYPDSDQRLIFLGTMVLGDETRAQNYGRDPERDMAGLVERIGPQRWRLVLPYPRWESKLDVMELVPTDG